VITVISKISFNLLSKKEEPERLLLEIQQEINENQHKFSEGDINQYPREKNSGSTSKALIYYV
jgi:hypothetical protein